MTQLSLFRHLDEVEQPPCLLSSLAGADRSQQFLRCACWRCDRTQLRHQAPLLGVLSGRCCGVWDVRAHRPFQEELVGVAVFSVPMQPKAAAAYGAPSEAKFCELGRFVLRDHVEGNGETWLLKRALGMLAKDKQRPDRRPYYDLCLSYSDPVPRTNAAGDLIHVGHVGRIYQAYGGSSAYLGRGKPRTHWLTQDGSIVSPRALSKLRNGERGAAYAYNFLRAHGAPAIAPGEKEADYIRRALQEGPFRKMRHNGNHAYVFPCGTHSNRQAIRRRMDKGLPRPTKTDLPTAA